MSERGRDEALEEWRSAAAYTRGRFRPDGYGCYRRVGSRFGFFLDFYRGTEKAARVCRKTRRLLSVPRLRCVKASLCRVPGAVGCYDQRDREDPLRPRGARS